ncbi:Flp family type IVb pilin [Peptoclostridium acidaminophilum]|nr:Flp family type IVb pilin [Peptoclostridium acidaminophilum]
MPSRWKRFLEIFAIRKDERGQGLVEYGLIILLIAIGVVASLGDFGLGVQGLYNKILEEIEAIL